MKNIFFALTIVLLPMIASAGDTPSSEFMNREVGVLRQYGQTSGYGFTLKQLITTLAKTGGKEEWKKENNNRWSYSLTINDHATNSTQRMAFVFQQEGKYASIVRYVDNDKEIKQQFLGSAVDQLLVPIGKALGSGKSIPDSTESKKSAQNKKSSIAGVYGDDEYKATIEGSKDKFSVQIDGPCTDDVGYSKPISLKKDGVKFKYDKDMDEDVASIDTEKCKLDIAIVATGDSQRELRINEANNCCRNSLTKVLIRNK